MINDRGHAASIRQLYDGKLFPNLLVEVCRNSERFFPTRDLPRGRPARPLAASPAALTDLQFTSQGEYWDLFDYVSRNRVAGLLILRHGEIVLEHYDLGNGPTTRWISMSIAKSISTTLVGAAIHDRSIHSVDDLLTRYIPALAGSGYHAVSIRHLLQMTSGVRWNEAYTDARSDRRQMLELQIAQKPGAILRYIASRPRASAPGTVWNYSTGETHVVGALLRAASGRWLADYLSERIWSKVGMEQDAAWWLESPDGLEVAGSGFSATLRDYGRFGMFMLADGVIDGERVLPEGWVAEATAPRWVGGQRIDYGYMWWPVPAADGSFRDRAYSARGIFGQYIYINPRHQTVIVVWSARSKPTGAEAILDNDFFNAAVGALA